MRRKHDQRVALISGGSSNVVLADNRINGSTSMDNMSGPTNVTSSVIGANRIAGPLSCAGNVPGPVNHGQPNTVSGPTLGQCSLL